MDTVGKLNAPVAKTSEDFDAYIGGWTITEFNDHFESHLLLPKINYNMGSDRRTNLKVRVHLDM
jgi:hypothetical protein